MGDPNHADGYVVGYVDGGSSSVSGPGAQVSGIATPTAKRASRTEAALVARTKSRTSRATPFLVVEMGGLIARGRRTGGRSPAARGGTGDRAV